MKLGSLIAIGLVLALCIEGNDAAKAGKDFKGAKDAKSKGGKGAKGGKSTKATEIHTDMPTTYSPTVSAKPSVTLVPTKAPTTKAPTKKPV
ncbi:hypothetical protein ACHAWO_001999 [Cyclotella atomus]|uniref:Uncharacterized protein n=1 Tax=Cyclotella atomus TaxID=382360 RepID=A0ABD3NFF4_9STRA